MKLRKPLLSLMCACFLSVAFVAGSPTISAAPPTTIVSTTSSNASVMSASPLLAQSNNDSSSRTRTSRRGMRGLVKLAIFAVVALIGVGKWLLGKFMGGE